MSRPRSHLAIIGAGPTALLLLYQLLRKDRIGQLEISRISIFEQSMRPGAGMPYRPDTTDRCHMANITSDELPELDDRFVDWLRNLDDAERQELGVEGEPASDEVYPRIAVGAYFENQFQRQVRKLRDRGIEVDIWENAFIADLRDHPDEESVEIIPEDAEPVRADRVVIATGHRWPEDDEPAAGYFKSPWPYRKFLPPGGQLYNHPVGLLGASLSAFDVACSLATLHGEFTGTDSKLKFVGKPEAPRFRIVMHSAEGWLPRLAHPVESSEVVIYSLETRDEVLALREKNGSFRLDRLFDGIARQPLAEALRADGLDDVASELESGALSLTGFCQTLSDAHSYNDPFAGLRKEIAAADKLERLDRPVHWRSVFDRWMQCVNFHAELLPAEDHLLLKKEVFPFLMNTIADLPIRSARRLLALHEAGALDLVCGKVEVQSHAPDQPVRITVRSEDGSEESSEFPLFVMCGGQGRVSIENFPFRSLVEDRSVSRARVPFVDEPPHGLETEQSGGRTWLPLPGIAVDSVQRIVSAEGKASPRISNLSFPQTIGYRPYAYGLNACATLAEIVAELWIQHADGEYPIRSTNPVAGEVYQEASSDEGL